MDKYTSNIDNIKLNKIKPIDIQKLLNNMSEMNLGSSIKLAKTVIWQIMKQAVINGLIPKNPAIGISIPQYTSANKRALTDEELKIILESKLLTDKERLFLYLGIFAGCRKSESLALTNSDFNFKDNLLTINKTLQYPNTNNPVVKNGAKTVAGNRVIPLTEPLKTLAETYTKNNSDKCLFMTKGKKLFTKTAYSNMWNQIKKKLNIDITSHYLRYTYATILYKSNVDIKTTEKVMGHSSISTTLDIYTSLNLNTNLVIDKINNYLTACSAL